MKAIKNTDEMATLLQSENENWRQVIYNQTGVVVILNRCSGFLFSKCGYIDLDSDSDYCFQNGVDHTSYTEITCISELVEYIKSMDGYKNYLCDISYGKFTKAELFWNIFARIICPEINQIRADSSKEQDWGLFSIGYYDGHVELNMALVDYDSAQFWIDINEETEINSALSELVNQMNAVTKDIDDVPQYILCENEPCYVPDDYTSLLEQLSSEGLFCWLAN
ncbi:MAG: hypothetical protein VB039_05390 [Oscillospiraceae bacterium]|nr:hypothetical protein [Oscillospiraceae bacterium]